MFKPCTTKTSIVNRSFDEMGNLLWQQEAAEFVEQYPQRRRPKGAASLLRQSASAGTLYRKTETIIPILNKRASGGELLTTQQRHQRDLFSGDLGIPDVNSHVGTIVHTFENMALQRQLAEKQRQQREREHSKYLAELMALQAATECDRNTPATKAAYVATTTTTKRTFIPSSSSTHLNSSKIQQLKKKTHETRQKIIQQILQNHPLHKDNNTKIPADPVQHLEGARQALSNTEVYYRNIDEDYRKNLFGTLTKRQFKDREYKRSNSAEESSSFCDEIVAQAFDEIFEGYSGLEDEEDLTEIKQIDNLVPADFSNSYGRPGLTPKKLPPLMTNKKSTTPQPPLAGNSSSSHTKKKSMPFLENKHRSSTIQNIFERFKTPNKTVTNLPHKLNKTCSDSSLKADRNFAYHSKKNAHIKREIEGQESSENLEQDFLRGSTVSQSFVKQLKVHKPMKSKAPPVPYSQETPSGQKHLKTSEALRQVLIFSKKSRSSGELVPKNHNTSIETRKYYRRLDDDVNIQPPQPRALERKTADGCSGFENATGVYSPQQVEEI